MATLRSSFYWWARLLGDAQTIRKPHCIPKGIANKLIGRDVVRRLWR